MWGKGFSSMFLNYWLNAASVFCWLLLWTVWKTSGLIWIHTFWHWHYSWKIFLKMVMKKKSTDDKESWKVSQHAKRSVEISAHCLVCVSLNTVLQIELQCADWHACIFRPCDEKTNIHIMLKPISISHSDFYASKISVDIVFWQMTALKAWWN